MASERAMRGQHVSRRNTRVCADRLRFRVPASEERAALKALQRRSSDIWEQYRQQLAARPDAIELPGRFIENGWVWVAVGDDDIPIGFSVVIPHQCGPTNDSSPRPWNTTTKIVAHRLCESDKRCLEVGMRVRCDLAGVGMEGANMAQNLPREPPTPWWRP
jgi:hypothetical protein